MRRDTDRLDTISDALAIILESHRQQMKTARADHSRLYEQFERACAAMSEIVKACPQYQPDEATIKRLGEFICPYEHFDYDG